MSPSPEGDPERSIGANYFMIIIEDFTKVEIQVGKVLTAEHIEGDVSGTKVR